MCPTIINSPSMFENTGNDDIVDEYTFGQMQDSDVALAALKQHWDTVRPKLYCLGLCSFFYLTVDDGGRFCSDGSGRTEPCAVRQTLPGKYIYSLTLCSGYPSGTGPSR